MDLLYTAHSPAGRWTLPDGPRPPRLGGERPRSLLGLAPYLGRGRSAWSCVPEGPLAFEVGPGAVGHGWFPQLAAGAPPDEEAIAAESVEGLAGFLDACLAAYPVDTSKLVLLGFSQGGVMAYALALRDPRRYAALVALSSWLPEAIAGRHTELSRRASRCRSSLPTEARIR